MGESKYEFVDEDGARCETVSLGEGVCKLRMANGSTGVVFYAADAAHICRIVSQAACVEYASPDEVADLRAALDDASARAEAAEEAAQQARADALASEARRVMVDHHALAAAEARAAALSEVVDKLAARLGPVPLRLTDENRVDDRSRTTSLRATPALMARIKRIVPMGDRNVLEALVSAAEAAQGAEPAPRKPPDGWMVFEHTEGPHRGKWGARGPMWLHRDVADTKTKAVEWCWRASGVDEAQRRRDAALASEAPKPFKRPTGCHAAGCAAGICAACSQADGRIYKHAAGCPCAAVVTVRKRGPEDVPKDGTWALVSLRSGVLKVARYDDGQGGRPRGWWRHSGGSDHASVDWWIPLDEF